MSREWKYGDVGMAATGMVFADWQGELHWAATGERCNNQEVVARNARRLLVIDPEDGEPTCTASMSNWVGSWTCHLPVGHSGTHEASDRGVYTQWGRP